ncbi:MAG: hypothetical protein A2Z49_10535 [Chloroflexi bacterium RBG_19FT_COMBO_56_12]|nr:MAG: hypothetical protein A2Z49_10535 [Chloroflexi bacterium RBG_19FT_COMBO_56_12]
MRTLRKRIGWLLFAALMTASCGQLPTGVSAEPPTAIVLEASATVTLPAIPVDLTATPVPTQPPTETTTPAPSETSAPVPAIEHLAVGQALTIASLDMLDDQNGWAIGGLAGETPHILRPGDGGNTWQDVTPPQAESDDALTLQATGYFLDTDHAWVFYSHSDGVAPAQAIVWHTENGGLGWQDSQPLVMDGIDSQFSVSNIQFIDSQSGWLLAHVGVGMNHDYVMLYRSQDSGVSWQRLIDPYDDGSIQACYKPGMMFTGAQQGWLPVNCNGVMPGALLYHTIDGGSTWETVNLPSPADRPTLFENPTAACGVDDVTFFTPSYGKLGMTCANYDTDPLTYLYYLYTTQDSGATWTSTAYPGGRLVFLNDQVGWAQNQDIYLTEDGGANWTKIANVSWEAEFDFVSETLGWAIARSDEETALVKSEDGGVYWTVIKPLVQ